MAEPHQQPQGGGPAGMPADDEKVNILIVDDRPEKILALESILVELGQNLVAASSGKEALRLLLRDEYAVILLDVSMPVMDGFETAQMVRQRRQTEHTPIIFVSAINAAETHASRGYSLGAVDYIFAPVVPEVLRAKVNVFIDLFKKTRQVKRQEGWLRVEAERRAQQVETRQQALLNRLNVGVFRSSWDGRLVEANPAFLRLLGCAPDTDPRTLHMRDFYVVPEEREAIVAELTTAGQSSEHNVRLRRRDGAEIWVRISKTLNVEPGRDRVIDGLAEDITERKQWEEAIVAKAEELARTNAELEQFAYIASHDLQEPLRMVSSFSSLLARRYSEQLDDQARQYIQTLIDSSGRMQTLIRDILALSRVGKIERPAEVKCDEAVAKALFNLQSVIEESGAQVSVEPLPQVLGDGVLIGQVFQNIIANAVKFRGKEPPRITVSAQRRERAWEFAVADNGIGIAPEHFDKIFGIFQRLHTRTEYPGTGIGLAFCRKVVQHHGGRIWVDSTPGGGSTFRFTLPDAGAAEPRTQSHAAAASEPGQPAASA